MTPGRFITFEGGEGAGKSTQAQLLAADLTTAGQTVRLTREPGGTPGAERIRAALLAGPGPEAIWTPDTETLLHFAAREAHVATLIRPALAAGTWVVSDRFTDSTLVYQGHGQGADPALIATLTRRLALTPDLTLILDIPADTSLIRLASRGNPDRYESLGRDFFARIRNGFRDLAAAAPQRCVLIDAEAPVTIVATRIRDAVRARLGA